MSESNVWLTACAVLFAVFAESVVTQCHGSVGACFGVGLNSAEHEQLKTARSSRKCTTWEITKVDGQ
jgi:hypothetical protein